MNMKKIIIFSSLVCIMSFLISCEKNIIDLQPLDQMTYSKAISTIDGLEGSILGVYFQGRFIYASNDYCLYKVAETDLVQPGSNVTDQPIFNAIITFNLFDATSTGVSDIWNGYYSGLNRCNSILANIDNVAVSPSDVANKNTVKGEAYYFRAYFHMQLVERWDNIVLANQVFSNPDATMKLAQKSDVYALIVSDLQQAITLLPEASSIDNRGRATKGVARHLLSKAYMDLGSLTSDASYWPKAAAMAVAVINDPAYVLLTDLTQIFIDENQDNSEIIFSWQFSKSDNSNVERCCQQMFPLYDRVVGVARTFADGGRPWARMVPSDYYWTLFDPNDKRLNAWHKRYWVYDATPLPATGVQLGDTVTVANMGTPKVTYPAASLIMPTTNKYLEDGFLGRALGDAQGYRDIIQWRKI